MSEASIAVIGASGFVGCTFIERMARAGSTRVVPFIHSSGNAARLARHGFPVHSLDLLSPSAVADALQGCTHVVNCSRGNTAVMTRGFRNLVEASVAAGVRRFVHISSVAVYGEAPRGDLLESAEPRPQPGTYGATKLQQDQRLEEAVGRGLPAVVLCPPNIGGAYSPFLLDIVQTLRRGQFALVEGGAHPCELVDVENLAYAIELALAPAAVADGRRTFVTDQAGATWRDLITRLEPLAEPAGAPGQLDREAATLLTTPRPSPRPSLRRALLRLISSDVRDALREDPLLARVETLAKTAARALPAGFQRNLRRRADGGESLGDAQAGAPSPSLPLVRQQLREVRYASTRARETLGYAPVVSFDESLDAFRRWYQGAYGWNTEWWALLKHLHT